MKEGASVWNNCTPGKPALLGTFPTSTECMYILKKIVLKCYTKFVLLYAITYSCTKGIGIIFNMYIKMRDSATVWGRAGMLLKVLPAIHHTPALNSMGQSSVLLSVAYLTATRVWRERRMVKLSEACQILMGKNIIKVMAVGTVDFF